MLAERMKKQSDIDYALEKETGLELKVDKSEDFGTSTRLSGHLIHSWASRFLEAIRNKNVPIPPIVLDESNLPELNPIQEKCIFYMAGWAVFKISKVSIFTKDERDYIATVLQTQTGDEDKIIADAKLQTPTLASTSAWLREKDYTGHSLCFPNAYFYLFVRSVEIRVRGFLKETALKAYKASFLDWDLDQLLKEDDIRRCFQRWMVRLEDSKVKELSDEVKSLALSYFVRLWVRTRAHYYTRLVTDRSYN